MQSYEIAPQQRRIANYLFVVFLIIVAALTYTLPEAVLDKSPILREIVTRMAIIFPSISAFGEHSSFPQVAQVVYAIGILLLPLIAFPLWQAFPKGFNPEKIDRLRRRPVIAFVPLIFVVLPVVMLGFFPGEPDAFGGPASRLSAWIYSSRLGFSIGSSIALFGALGAVLLVLNYVRSLPTVFREGRC